MSNHANTLRKARARDLQAVQYHGPNDVRFGTIIKTGRKWVTLQFGAGDKKRITMDEARRYVTGVA